MVLLIGIAGSGKTTFAKKFFPKHIRISLDEIENHDRLKEFEIIEENLKKGNNIVIDDTNLTKTIRVSQIMRAKECKARVTGVFFDFPMLRIQLQNQKRDRPVPEHILFKMKNQLERPKEDEGFDYIQILNENFKI